MTQVEFSNVLNDELGNHKDNTPSAQLLSSLDTAEKLLFQGKEDIQPVKIYQLKRIYKLAVTFIDVITVIWPYIKMIFKLLKK